MGQAARKGLMRATSFEIATPASQRSTARWAFNQNSGELPNNLPNRIAISGLRGRRSRRSSLMDCRETPMASASPDTVRMHTQPIDTLPPLDSYRSEGATRPIRHRLLYHGETPGCPITPLRVPGDCVTGIGLSPRRGFAFYYVPVCPYPDSYPARTIGPGFTPRPTVVSLLTEL